MSEPILTALFTASKGVVSIAKALDLIESLESKLDRLMQAKLNAAWKTLVHACNSSASEQHQYVLIHDARNGFNEATHLEKGERLFYAYLGLAICFYLLNDINNTKTNLIETAKISIFEEVYLKEKNSLFGFNKYKVSVGVNIFNPKNLLNLIMSVPKIPLVSQQKAVIRNYNKSKSNSLVDIYKKVNAEEIVIPIVTKVYLPSDVFKNLETKSLELIRLQKECLEIINNIGL